MKKAILLSFGWVLLTVSMLSAQGTAEPLPPSTRIVHHLIEVSFNSTTVLVFPSAVRPVDRGDRDILAQKQPGVDNVLKLKAARKNFEMTNLHVFTADGRLYAFDVAYTDSLATTHDLRPLVAEIAPSPAGGIVHLSQEPFNSEEMTQLVAAVRALPGFRGSTCRRDQMIFRLTGAAFSGPVLFFRFRITNLSRLDFPLDFVRLYIRDRQKAKRTSVQERELTPLYSDSMRVIPGKSHSDLVIGVPLFTLAADKQFLVEAYEKNGGRLLTLRMRNKALLNAIKL